MRISLLHPAVLLAVVGVVLAGCAGSSSAKKGSTVVKIGWAGPLSGDQAYFGRSWLNGVKMAAQDFRFTGRLRGATVKVQALDDAADPSRGKQTAHALVKAGVAGVVADFNSGVTLATAPIYHRASVPQVTVSSSPQITQLGYRNIAQVNENDNFQGGQMATFAARKLHIKSVAVFNDSLPFGRGVSDLFLASARPQGITAIGGNTTLNPSAGSYSSALTPALARHPQAIYFGGTIVPGDRLCGEARAAGFAGPFLGPDGLYHPDFITACGSKAGAAYVTTSVPPYTLTPALGSFAANYKRHFHAAPGPYSVYGYDEAGFLLTAINAAAKLDRSSVVNALHTITHQGVLGPERINRAGQLLNAPNFVYEVKGKQFVTVFSNRGM